ncbi:hypothetical protein WR25_16297 [Diploscapter pachys]|uniref:Uncharacterized protein n=1 Tax=Diploscapter pachys TaxID=2018661 RepID=A0A2A2KIN9_9BILA|nr:hypothetical protein WR25_16297 [Diploscapter pachys]
MADNFFRCDRIVVPESVAGPSSTNLDEAEKADKEKSQEQNNNNNNNVKDKEAYEEGRRRYVVSSFDICKSLDRFHKLRSSKFTSASANVFLFADNKRVALLIVLLIEMVFVYAYIGSYFFSRATARVLKE